MIEGKPLFNQIEQTMVSDIAVVGVAGFFAVFRISVLQKLFLGESAGKTTRRGLWDC